jgi:hypothetical protein
MCDRKTFGNSSEPEFKAPFARVARYHAVPEAVFPAAGTFV